MSSLTRETQPRSGNAHEPVQNLTFDRLRALSLTIRTMLDANTFFTTVIPPSIRNQVFVVHDETYPNQPDVDEQRHFIICSNQPTYNHILLDLRSKGLLVTPGIKRTYWTSVASKLEKGDVCKASPCSAYVPLVQPGLEITPARPPRRVIYGRVQVDVVAMIAPLFPQFSSVASTNANNTLGLIGIPPLALHASLGPTGQPTCLSIILGHNQPWTARAAHRAYKLASKEIKGLARTFRLKHQTLADKCRNDPIVNLTKESAAELIDGIQDRTARKKMMVRIIRERKQFTKDGRAMLGEYRALMAHYCRLQKACIAAANEAYNIDLVLVPGHLYPIAPLPS